MKRALPTLLVLGCLLTSPALAQEAEPSAAYQALAERATASVTAGDLDQALVLFRELHAMSPSARTLWALGRVHFERSEYVVAHDHLRAALDDPRRPLDVAQRANATELLRTSANLIARVTLELSPPGATVLVDGVQTDERPLRLDPGEHRLRIEAPGHGPTDRRVELAGGAQTTVQVALAPVSSAEGAAEAPREIQLDVRGPEGLRLYLRPTISGLERPLGAGDLILPTERSATVMSGVYRFGVEREGSIVTGVHQLPLSSDAVLQVDYVDYEDLRVGAAATVIIAGVLGVAGIVAGAVLLGEPPGTARDASIVALTGGIALSVIALPGLAFVTVEDDAVVRVHPAWDAAGRL